MVTLIIIRDFSKSCNQLFDVSAQFLKGFNPVGMDYNVASVVICLLVPLIVYVVLIKKTYFSKSA
jgi:hypothetical protein